MTPQETKRKVRKQPIQTPNEAVEAQKNPKPKPKPKRQKKEILGVHVDEEKFFLPSRETCLAHIKRVELLASRRTDKEAKAMLTGISMGLKYALGINGFEERSGRFYLTAITGEL
jgi:hypothetical protein